MFGLIKKTFIGLLTGIVSASNHTKCMSLKNQKCMNQSTLINLHSNEYSQELHYYIFAVKLDAFVESCSTLNDLSNLNMCSKLNRRISMITGIDE